MKKEKTSEPTDLRILNDRQTAAMLNFTALTLDFSQEGLLEEIISKSNLRTDLFVITVIVKGSITLKINLKEFRLKKNDLLTIPPDSTKETIEISEDAILKVIAYTSGFLLPLNLPDNFWEMTSYFSSENNPVVPFC
jgi:flagellar biosynthesis protein FlhB